MHEKVNHVESFKIILFWEIEFCSEIVAKFVIFKSSLCLQIQMYLKMQKKLFIKKYLSIYTYMNKYFESILKS